MFDFNNTAPSGNEEAQLRERLALQELLSIISADVNAGRLRDSNAVFADIREMIEETRQKQE